MEEKTNKLLPLEFKKLEVKKKTLNKIEEKKKYVEVSFYQSKKNYPEFFYKPISKIIDFNF